MERLKNKISVIQKGPSINVSPLVLRLLNQTNIENQTLEATHLQFELHNNSKTRVKCSFAKISYYGLDKNFIGSNDAFSFEEIEINESLPMDIQLTIPDNVDYAKLSITIEKYGIIQKYRNYISIIIIALVLLLIWVPKVLRG